VRSGETTARRSFSNASSAIPCALRLYEELKNTDEDAFLAPKGGLAILLLESAGGKDVTGEGACGVKAAIINGDGAAEVRYRVGRVVVLVETLLLLSLRAEDNGERGEGGTIGDTNPFTPTPGSELVLKLCKLDIMVKLRRIWLPNRLDVEPCAEGRAKEELSAAVGPVLMCGELAMSCKIPEIRVTIS